jgi:predicted nuclease of predicted toxin-antitoxin system
MRFLVDAQLPRRLAHFLAAAGHDSLHTLDLPRKNRTPDAQISQVADDENRIVVSKDEEFVDAHLLRRDLRCRTLTTNKPVANP